MHRAPRQLPPIAYLLDDAGGPEAVARYLGVSPRTIARWRAGNDAPRAVCLALYWESRWGIQHLHADATNEAAHARQWVSSLERELDRLRGVIHTLETAQGWESANSPVFNAA